MSESNAKQYLWVVRFRRILQVSTVFFGGIRGLLFLRGRILGRGGIVRGGF